MMILPAALNLYPSVVKCAGNCTAPSLGILEGSKNRHDISGGETVETNKDEFFELLPFKG